MEGVLDRSRLVEGYPLSEFRLIPERLSQCINGHFIADKLAEGFVYEHRVLFEKFRCELSETPDSVAMKACEPFERRSFQIFDEQAAVADILFTVLQSSSSNRDVESLKVRFWIGRTIAIWYFDFSRIGYPHVRIATGNRGLPSSFQQSIDFGGSTSSMMDLRLHGRHFRRSLGDVVAKIADIRCLVSRFPSLSAFTASKLGLPFSQLLLFVPIGDFLFFRHWFFERGAFPSRSASGPSWISVDILVGVIGDIARIQVNAFGFVVLRILCRGRRTFRVPLFDGRFFARVFDRKVVPARLQICRVR
ncbi:hypothetical protein YC2023_107868 [Brassica napus]